LDEWLREFYHEGRRRTDLIRWGQFVGEKATRHWEGRGGEGKKSFDSPDAWNTEAVSIDAHYALYPIPETEMVVNPNLVQNPGY